MQSERNCSTHAIRLSLSHVCAIVRRCGGRDDEEDDVLCRAIAEAVFKVRRHMNALSGSEGDRVAGEFERRSAREHIEELARARVKVSDLSGTRRNTLLNDAEIRALQKMPTVADGSPGVVFGGRPINWHGVVWHVPILIESFFRNVRSPESTATSGTDAGQRHGSQIPISPRQLGSLIELARSTGRAAGVQNDSPN